MTKLMLQRGERLFWLSHGLTMSIALAYIWFISTTSYVTSAVQFVSPLAIIILTHTVWQFVILDDAPGFSRAILRRTSTSIIALFFLVVLAAIFSPMPTEAAGSGFAEEMAVYIVCLLIVTAAIISIYFIMRFIFKCTNSFISKVRGRNKDDNNSRLGDFATLVITMTSIVVMSVEGVTPMLNFSASGQASSRYVVANNADKVWQAASVATSPDYPLPLVLKSIPQPVKILTDEGLALGARRTVLFSGREGRGELSMKIVHRSDTEAVFEVLSDTSPVAFWIKLQSLTFHIENKGDQAQLTVKLQYERLLSPAWFFKPYMGVAAYLAVDTLARDIRQRAEILAGKKA